MPYNRPYAGGFVDYPSTTTPINANALNTIDVGVKTANDQFQTVTTAQRAALTPTVGQAVWDSDLRQLMVFMNATGGNAWQPVGNTIVCTSTSRPLTPFEGQRIYETDTDKSYVYNGSAFVQYGEQPILTTVQRDALPTPTAGTMIYNSTLTRVQVYYDGAWVDADTFRTVGSTKYNNAVSPPAVRATKNATQSISAATVTAISFPGTNSYDTDAMHDAVTNNTRITFNTAGVYFISGSYATTAAFGGLAEIFVYVDGNNATSNRILSTTADSASGNTVAVAGTYKFNAAQYIELGCYLANAKTISATSTNANNHFSATWIGTGA